LIIDNFQEDDMKMFYEVPMGNPSETEVLDKVRVRELVEFDRYCRDYGLFPQERACWFDDGEVFATWFKGPIDRFIANSSRKDKASAFHKINNTMVWLNGNKAIAECLCIIQFRTNLNNEPVDLHVWGRLHFRAEKRDDKWGLVYFEGIYEKDRIDPVFLDSEFSIPRNELMEFRPCNWNQCFRLARTSADAFGGGLKNANEWAGSDKPETIQRLYNASSEWFFS
jgi:hypothetical protein